MGIRSQELKKVGGERKRREIYDEGGGRVNIALHMHINLLKRSVVTRLSFKEQGERNARAGV